MHEPYYTTVYGSHSSEMIGVDQPIEWQCFSLNVKDAVFLVVSDKFMRSISHPVISDGDQKDIHPETWVPVEPESVVWILLQI